MAELKNILGQRIIKKSKTKGDKTIGYLVAGLMDKGIIAIGFSLCHKTDRYDFIKKRRVPGFGKKLAMERALKYASDGAIQVPASIAKQVRKFATRCERYYQGAAVQAICTQLTKQERW